MRSLFSVHFLRKLRLLNSQFLGDTFRFGLHFVKPLALMVERYYYR
jgi:hypothetical protein